MNKVFITFFLVLFACWTAFSQSHELIEKAKTVWDSAGILQLQKILTSAKNDNIPLHSLENKVWEGFAKSKSQESIIKALQIRYQKLSMLKQQNPSLRESEYEKRLYDYEKDQIKFDNKQDSIFPVAPKHQTVYKVRYKNIVSDSGIHNTKSEKIVIENDTIKNLNGQGKQKLEKIDEKMEKRMQKLEKQENKLERRNRLGGRERE